MYSFHSKLNEPTVHYSKPTTYTFAKDVPKAGTHRNDTSGKVVYENVPKKDTVIYANVPKNKTVVYQNVPKSDKVIYQNIPKNDKVTYQNGNLIIGPK